MRNSPLECNDCHNRHGLENHGQSRLSPRHTTIKQADTGDNKEYEHAHDHLIDIFELNAGIRCIDVDLLRVATLSIVRIPFGEVARP